MKKKMTLSNIIRFITGYSRLFLYLFTKRLLKKYKMEADLLPLHKREQFEERLVLADKQCLLDGQCKMCGCSTPALFMIDDGCDGGCFGAMMDKLQWDNYKKSTTAEK